ncbi:CDP-alcohol phosphatidyltransferase family protein [Georgenia subflava]|uniref:CDP-alcohol phosphatidyltransferase family protein n=1 Tax=Georgenia subflava TaxID=1622177 RepID=UPI00128D993D|nr:CDP-alcohol phosphatidyltransferase family protein [Georgenia subflava]
MTVPNLITAARLLVLTPLFVVLALDDQVLAATAVLVVLGVSDWADGYLARRLDQVSRVGTVLDPVADRLGLVVVALTLVLAGAAPWWVFVVLAVPDLIFWVALGVLLGRRRPVPRNRPSVVGKARTALLMAGLPLLLLSTHETLVGTALPAVAWGLTVAGCVGHVVAAGQYAVQGWRGLARQRQGQPA